MRKFLILIVLTLTACGGSAAQESFPRLEALPPFTPSEAPPRLHAAPMNEFIPGDHGEILPFLGQLNMGDWGWATERYGFIDAQGRIICDPIFDSVRLISYGDRSAFVVTGDGGAAVIAHDGSFFRWFDDVYSGWWGLEFDHPYIPVKHFERWGVIDFDGNEILPPAFINAPLFSDGLAAVFRYREEFGHLHEYFMANANYYYIDSGGVVISGPFPSPQPFDEFSFAAQHLEMVMFHGGLAMNFYDGQYGFIDTSGQLVIPRNYLLFTRAQFGWNDADLALVAIAETQVGIANIRGNGHGINYALIDRQGNHVAIMKQSDPYGVHEYSGFYFVSSMDWVEMSMYDHWGNSVDNRGGWYLGGGYFRTWIDRDNIFEGIRLHGNGIDRELGSVDLQWLYGDWFTKRLDETDERGDDIFFQWNAQTEETRDVVMHIWDRRDNRITVANGWHWGQKFGVIDDEGNAVIEMEFDSLSPIGENYFAVQGRYGGLLDQNGNWIIRTRLSGNFD